MSPEHVAAAFLLATSAVIYVHGWFSRGQSELDRQIAEALDDGPDLAGNESWWSSQGRSALR